MLVARTALLALLIPPLAAQGDSPTTALYRLTGPVPPAFQAALQCRFDVLGPGFGELLNRTDTFVVVTPSEVRALLAMAPGAQLVAHGRPYSSAGTAGLDMPDPAYYTVAEIEAEIDARVAAFPGLARKVDLTALPGASRTHENRQIFALKVSDNVAVDEDEPSMVVAAQHHARELNSPHMVIAAMDRILQGYAGDPALRALVDGNELWFVPMVNPDGVHHVWNVDNFWRKNRRDNRDGNFGVDLNRNYPFLWGLCGASTRTGSQVYRGPSPGSEPETMTMRALVDAVRPEIYIDFHSYGQEVLALYPPCASVSSTIGAFAQRYADDLRAPMSYAFRAPSASGEAPHDHWAASGALSFLIEVGTSFQPPFTTTVAEETRVWPGLRHALTTWRPAVRGHVRSIFQGQPVQATITFSPGQFAHGEVTESRARDGRYGLWLPLGTWSVTWSAQGFQPRTKTVTVTAYDQPQIIDVDLEPVWPAATLVKSGSERIGTSVQLTYTSPGDAGLLHFLGWSLGTSPGIDLGGCRVLPLNNDFLLQAAVGTNPVLSPTWAVLDANGQAAATLQIPNNVAVINFTTWLSGVTLDTAYTRLIKKFSAPVSVTPAP